jgi:hypothetical protein
MDVDFNSIVDDFFVNMSLQTTLALPHTRETILHFCEAVQKEFPEMTSFYQRDAEEYVLEGNRETGRYEWLELHACRLTAGSFNPRSAEAAYRFHHWLAERSVYFLGVSGLDIESLDLLFGFNLDFRGNRDSIVADALLNGSPLGALPVAGERVCLEFEPSLVLAMDDSCSLQARISVETHSSSFQVRTGQYDDEPISVYLTVRQYPEPGKVMDLGASLMRQCMQCEDLACRLVVPQVIRPIAAAIAAAH